MSRHTLTHANDLFVGQARNPGAFGGFRGVPTMPVAYIDLGTPAAVNATAVCASQSVGAGAAALINGTVATNSVATFATPRNVTGTWTGTAIMTVKGTDQYNARVTETMSAGGTTFTGKKAFKTVDSVVFSAAVTVATVGFGDVIGLPYRLRGRRDILNAYADDTQDIASATVVGADTTSPATGLTGDVRGTIDFNTASNGTVRFGLWTRYIDIDTDSGVYGVAQFGA